MDLDLISGGRSEVRSEAHLLAFPFHFGCIGSAVDLHAADLGPDSRRADRVHVMVDGDVGVDALDPHSLNEIQDLLPISRGHAAAFDKDYVSEQADVRAFIGPLQEKDPEMPEGKKYFITLRTLLPEGQGRKRLYCPRAKRKPEGSPRDRGQLTGRGRARCASGGRLFLPR